MAKMTGFERPVGLEVVAPAEVLAFASSAVADPTGVESATVASVAVCAAVAPVSLAEPDVGELADAEAVLLALAALVEMADEADCEADMSFVTVVWPGLPILVASPERVASPPDELQSECQRDTQPARAQCRSRTSPW